MAAFGAEIGPSLVLGEVNPDCKPVVVGIDFGTAYSGIAFAMKGMPGNVKYGAPTAIDPLQTKVPTVLLELPDGKWEFGHTAEAKYNEILAETEPGAIPSAHLYKRFKMVLKGKTSGTDTLKAMSISGKSCSLMTLVVKALEFLKDYAIGLVSVSYAGDVVPSRDVQWVLTVPAIWTDFGKAFMRKAAFKAGLMDDEQSDNLMLVLEPEGASLAVHVGAAQHGILGAGSRFMVLDCGGGTIDITVHEVQSIRPLVMKAIAAPVGDDSGGEKVNVLFRDFLKELLGDLFDEKEQGLLTFYTIYAAFEKLKLMWDPSTDPTNLQLVDVLEKKGQLTGLAAAWNAKHPDRPIITSNLLANGFLPMSKALMLSFFEPSLKSVVDQTKATLRDNPGVRYIMVVGGFGSSKVLTERVRAEFNNKGGVRVILPDGNPKPQGAIVHGAVYFGLYKDIVSSRVAAYSYGIAVREDGVDEVFSILVRKGDELPNGHRAELEAYPVVPHQTEGTWRVYHSDKTNPTTVIGEHKLGSLTATFPPNEDQSKRKQTGVFHFGGSEIRVTIEDAEGNVTRGVVVME